MFYMCQMESMGGAPSRIVENPPKEPGIEPGKYIDVEAIVGRLCSGLPMGRDGSITRVLKTALSRAPGGATPPVVRGGIIDDLT